MSAHDCNKDSYAIKQQYDEAKDERFKDRLVQELQDIASSRGYEINRLRRTILEMAKTEDYEACKLILMKELISLIEDEKCKVDSLR